MKRNVFVTKVCKAIAENKVKGNARMLLVQIAANGHCRPVKPVSRNYSDNTADVIEALKLVGVEECLPSRRGNYFKPGYFIRNDAPRGGKLGTIIEVNFE